MFLKNRNIIFKMKKSKVTDYAALNIRKFPFHNYSPMFIVFFMTRVICKSNDKKFPLVLAFGVLQGDHLV